MKTSFRLFVPALLAALLATSTSSLRAEEKATRTPVAESDKVQVFEIRQPPGAVNTPSTSGTRVIRALSGGMLLRTYADGRTETSEWKTGEVQIQEAGPAYTVTNVGKTEVVLYVVRLK